MSKNIKLIKLTGEFAENKDIAKELRLEHISPRLELGQEVTIDFAGVRGATQSFIHALISDPIRRYKDVAYDKLLFKNASPDIRELISIVYRYMQESI